MLKNSYPFSQFRSIPDLIKDYVGENDRVTEFCKQFYSDEAILNKLNKKEEFAVDRNLLYDILAKQNAQISLSESSKKNILSLKNQNTFCITTGHQLNLLGGPLYSIIKIAQAIALTAHLGKKFSQHQFVPVFWMASEDHDFEEINHLNLFGKNIEWVKPVRESLIAGKFETASLSGVFDEIENLFRENFEKEIIQKFRNYYLQEKNLAEATRHLYNDLFGNHGLIILDGNERELKKLMVQVYKKEITSQIVHKTVTETNARLQKHGYHQQAHVRECNLFYLDELNIRHRIITDGTTFTAGNLSFTTDELLKIITEYPERISPNALLRPVYQELVLPNLVYVGGAGEISYWMQLRHLFDSLNVSFPVLRVRDSIVLINQKQREDLETLSLDITDLQKEADYLMKQFVRENSGIENEITQAQTDLQTIKEKISALVQHTDSGLANLTEAEFVKMSASLKKIEEKLIRSQKQKDETTLNRIKKLRGQLFPDGSFAERKVNFLPYYLANKTWVDDLIRLLSDNASNCAVRVMYS
ncbi:MAG: bacillithiol biosynthesis cysteine-adding enzyme BshC [Crocinitomicaceae bacterium]|nr:bacillithiol biosynthesis cysteine-adding enzyme BshC [Crocinitomicaceae bacterium]MBK8926094.1 bacillithiol biosynthesis cysteine-adding enzyme BshC [Crocinitomicaceae bacterium]